MAMLAPRLEPIARALIAGLLVWVLAINGHSFAAATPYTGLLDGSGLSTSLELCAEEGGGEKRAPDHAHTPCSCCILCPSCYLGVVSWVPDVSPNAVQLPQRGEGGIIFRRIFTLEVAPQLGWTSSWSQRAPPRLSVRLPPPRAQII